MTPYGAPPPHGAPPSSHYGAAYGGPVSHPPPVPGYTGPVLAPAAQGVLLSVPRDLHLPSICANCTAPSDTTVSVSRQVSRFGSRVTRRYQIPHCRTCASRLSKHSNWRILLGLAVFVAALAAAGAMFLLRFLPAPILVVVPVLLSGGLGAVALVVLSPRKPAAPATSSVESIDLVAFQDAGSTFYCTNPAWAYQVAQANGGHAAPVPARTMYRAWAHPVFGLVIGAIAAGASWSVSHPKVCLDNATKAPVEFWMDGERLAVVGPGSYALENLPFGDHVFGWSKVGAAKPEGEAEGDVSVGDAHLVNAYGAGCYVVDGAVYGSAKMSSDFHPGPQPLQNFYGFDKVDVWFSGLPRSIRTKNSGETRVAVRRYTQCMEMRAACSDAQVKQALACDVAAEDDLTASRCWSDCRSRLTGGRR